MCMIDELSKIYGNSKDVCDFLGYRELVPYADDRYVMFTSAFDLAW